jgi:hypothetical protein
MPLKKVLVALAVVLFAAAAYQIAQYAIETLLSDAATRLAYQIRDEAASLKRSGQAKRTFEHAPRAWPEGISGPYRIEITETRTSPRPGHRSIGVARNLTEETWYATSYHLNFVEVPNDVVVSHQAGEATRVTLELKEGKVLLTGLQ